MTFTLGQRVRTTVDAPAAWPGAFSAAAGALGTIANGPDTFDTYGVLLDGDPDQMPASYTAQELRSA
ncbi:hypothetical protein [Streptomyces erythrochromogenes]|uniref:hypothetical protein n=1 Tax=Streptomyces erythrochromogenes TaxID=285574 RepID=UPI0033CD2CEA